jgi:hypothetical protein
MANLVFVRGAGRGTEWAERINNNDPAASELVLMVLATAGIETDAALRVKDTFADVVAGATNEATNSGYAKKVLAEGAITITYDDTNFRTELDIADQTWTAVGAGDGWNDVVFGYDPVGSQTMADILPLTIHDFVVTPDGSDVTAQIAVFYRAAT